MLLVVVLSVLSCFIPFQQIQSRPFGHSQLEASDDPENEGLFHTHLHKREVSPDSGLLMEAALVQPVNLRDKKIRMRIKIVA